MENKIIILSPGKNCWKTRKIIAKIQQFLNEQKISVDFIIKSELKEILEYKTWILPTIIINNKIVARGYKPNNDLIINSLNLKTEK